MAPGKRRLNVAKGPGRASTGKKIPDSSVNGSSTDVMMSIISASVLIADASA